MPKGVVGICKSKMDRQHNVQRKKRKKNDLQNITHTTNDLVEYLVLIIICIFIHWAFHLQGNIQRINLN
jgi:hypothetical protein